LLKIEIDIYKIILYNSSIKRVLTRWGIVASVIFETDKSIES